MMRTRVVYFCLGVLLGFLLGYTALRFEYKHADDLLLVKQEKEDALVQKEPLAEHIKAELLQKADTGDRQKKDLQKVNQQKSPSLLALLGHKKDPVQIQNKKNKLISFCSNPFGLSKVRYAGAEQIQKDLFQALLPQATQQKEQKTIFSSVPSDFILHKMGSGSGPTLLIVGGIQGDEPGGFSAAALIASHYAISFGNVWVIPDLNLVSILKRSRGVAGDMNRKFAEIDPKDPDYPIIEKLKAILLDKDVDLVLNLHDGSGFYRHNYEDALHNPKKWGQTIIIDQEEIEAKKYPHLYKLASQVQNKVNEHLLKPEHKYHVLDTRTREGNVEMAKSLSYFSICNGKAAFGLEASKEFTTEYRAYYHLRLIEAFMQEMGIKYERDFELSPQYVAKELFSHLAINAYDSKVALPLDNIRPLVQYLPFKKDETPMGQATKPLLLFSQNENGSWRVAFGNRTLTTVQPIFVPFDTSLNEVILEKDGALETVPFGSLVTVEKDFIVKVPQGYRVNAIGADKEVNGSEANIRLSQKDFSQRFSLDKNGCIYRVEVYKENAFSGMILIAFEATRTQTLTQQQKALQKLLSFRKEN